MQDPNDELFDSGLISLVVPESAGTIRVDRALSLLTGCSRARAVAEIVSGHVRLENGLLASKSRQLHPGDLLEFPPHLLIDELRFELAADATVAVNVIYEDPDILVIDKEAGQVVHPGVGNDERTLVAGIIARYPEIASVGTSFRPGIVHRLDRPTSGLMVVARTEGAYEALSEQMRDHVAARTYLALVAGEIEPIIATLDGPIGKSRRGFGLMEVSAQGRWARTHYHRVAVVTFDDPYARYSIVQCELETGRTHQIRVHLGSHGYPIYGDRVYGSKLDFGPRIFLHARELGFSHPITGENVVFRSPIPNDLLELISRATFIEGDLGEVLEL